MLKASCVYDQTFDALTHAFFWQKSGQRIRENNFVKMCLIWAVIRFSRFSTYMALFFVSSPRAISLLNFFLGIRILRSANSAAACTSQAE